MKVRKLTWVASLVPVLAGCAAVSVDGDIQRGRRELLDGKPATALTYFQRAEEINPDYVLDFSILPEGVWTYVGRAYYDLGDFKRAADALKTAQSLHPQDNLAKLYIGLALARIGDTEKGAGDIRAALAGLAQWLDDTQQNNIDGPFWDPLGEIRGSIHKLLAEDIPPAMLLGGAEDVGRRFEEEVDSARRDKLRQEQRDRDNDHPK